MIYYNTKTKQLATEMSIDNIPICTSTNYPLKKIHIQHVISFWKNDIVKNLYKLKLEI
jgi:hypothetical protein